MALRDYDCNMGHIEMPQTKSLQKPKSSDIVEPNHEMVCVERARLEDLERRLIPLLVEVQRALGKEPTVMTPEERRRIVVERRGKT